MSGFAYTHKRLDIVQSQLLLLACPEVEIGQAQAADISQAAVLGQDTKWVNGFALDIMPLVLGATLKPGPDTLQR